jgi:drug/metabolite transporter (DMT)-like permease
LKKGYLYIAATAFLFSTAEIASKLLANQINPYQLVFLRFLIGGLFLLPFALVDMRKRGLKLKAGDWLFFALTGFLGVTVSMSLFQLSVVYAKASTVAVVFSVNTAFTALFAVFVLKERFTLWTGLAAGLGLLGLAAMLYPFALNSDLNGVALAVASAVLFALYGVIGAKRVARYGGFVLNSFSFLAGVLLLLPAMLLLRVPVFSGVSLTNLPIILYCGIFVTGLGYFFYLSAMKETSAIETSAVFFIKPALAPLLALAILGEALKANVFVGMAFIAASAFVMFRKRFSAKMKSVQA